MSNHPTTNHPHRTEYALAARGAVAMANAPIESATLRAMLYRAQEVEHYANAMQVAAVAAARAEGCSWAEIAEWLGVTRQAAQQRFGSTD